MAPGEYTLLVKYYNSVFDKESDVYSLVIRIGDPWYASWWAYLIYALCLLLLAALLIRSFILRSKRKKQELLNEIEKRHQKNVFESKLRFFTNIAHEFCTPLTLIYGPCGRILSSKGLSKFVVDYVQMIQTNAERLNNLIHELIEFRRIETGNREVRVESLNVSSIVKGIAKTFVEMAKSRNITFLSKIPEQVMWNSDKGFLNTIIINLISNAFKYTPDGQSIKIEVDTSGENMLTLRVANEGSTIKEKDFQYIFNRYAILDNFENQDEKNFSRNGLGLAISYNMAKLLNGTLKVENTPDGWVMFTLTLPVVELTTGVVETKRLTAEYIPKIDTQSILKLPQYEFDKMRPTLLVVDDEIEMLWFIGEIFSADFNVVTLQDPERLDQVMNEVYPNVIICDVMMPVKDGYETCREIKNDPKMAQTPVVMLTAKVESEDVITGIEAGADDYITKPFDVEILRSKINSLMKKRDDMKRYFSNSSAASHNEENTLSTNPFMDAVVKNIEKHLDDSTFEAKVLADSLNMSLPTLYRKIKQYSDLSILELTRNIRLKKAAELLASQQYSVQEVAEMVGFNDTATFRKRFTEQYGVTPSQYGIPA